jgi:hypothetical protein
MSGEKTKETTNTPTTNEPSAISHQHQVHFTVAWTMTRSYAYILTAILAVAGLTYTFVSISNRQNTSVRFSKGPCHWSILFLPN